MKKQHSYITDFFLRPDGEDVLGNYMSGKDGFEHEHIYSQELYFAQAEGVSDDFIRAALECGVSVTGIEEKQAVYFMSFDREKLEGFVSEHDRSLKIGETEIEHREEYKGPRLSEAQEIEAVRKYGLLVGRESIREPGVPFLPVTVDLSSFVPGHGKHFMKLGIAQSAFINGVEIPNEAEASQIVDLIVDQVKQGNKGSITLVKDEDGFVSVEGQDNRKTLATRLIGVIQNRQNQLRP